MRRWPSRAPQRQLPLPRPVTRRQRGDLVIELHPMGTVDQAGISSERSLFKRHFSFTESHPQKRR
jgi:hypothetical protein